MNMWVERDNYKIPLVVACAQQGKAHISIRVVLGWYVCKTENVSGKPGKDLASTT